MSHIVIRCITSAVVLCVIEIVITSLHHSNPSIKNSTSDSGHYVVQVPKALLRVYFILFLLGFFLFAIFLISMLMGNPTATTGHLLLFLAIAAIGLLVQLWASRWRIVVCDHQLEIHRLFHKCIRLSFSQLDGSKIETQTMRHGTKQRIVLYQSGKKLIAVDALSEHYGEFADTLKHYGKLNNIHFPI